MVGLYVSDRRLDGLVYFEHPAFFIVQPLVLAPVLDLNARVFLIHTPVAHVGVDHLGLDAYALHQDDTLLDLLMYCVPVIRVAGKASDTHDQVVLERHSQTDLHSKFVRVATLALVMHFTSGAYQL